MAWQKQQPKARRLHGQTYKAAPTSRDAILLLLCLRRSDALSCRGARGAQGSRRSLSCAGSPWLRVWGEGDTRRCHFRLSAFLLPAAAAGRSLGTAFALSRSAARACSSGQAAVPAAGLCPADARGSQERPAAPRAPEPSRVPVPERKDGRHGGLLSRERRRSAGWMQQM